MSANSIAINRLRAKLAEAKRELVDGVRTNVRAELETTVKALFASGQDVEGEPWAERRRRSGGGLALQSLASSVSVSVEGEDVVVRVSHPKAKFQQGGWKLRSGKHTPARLMVPGRKRVGKAWLNAIRRAADRTLRAAARAAKT